MTTDPSDKTVPTLIDVIIPGKTDAKSQQPDIQDTSDIKPETPTAQSALEKQIERQVSKLLVRHMEEIRKEVIRRVLIEVRAYLDSNTK